MLGLHEVLKAASAMGANLALGQHSTGGKRNKELDRLAKHQIGHTDHCCLLHARELIQNGLNLLGRDLLAAALNDVVFAPDEVEEAILLHPAEIACIEHRLPAA